MSTFKEFEEINVWKRSRVLVKTVYCFTKNRKEFIDFGLMDQLRRSAISISSNIAEGFGRETIKEFIRFLYIAKASCGELRSQLYLVKDLDDSPDNQTDDLINEAKEISKMISGLIRYLIKLNKPNHPSRR